MKQTNKHHAHQILAFAQVMRSGSFSAAARHMGVTQSALSQQIAKLEERVGARVITRSQNGVELTQAGAELFDLAEQYASLSQEIEERLHGYGQFESGNLNIIANAPQPALGLIARYGDLYPRVEVHFTLYDWTRASAMLSDHTVDIALITRPRKNDQCVYRKVADTRYVLYVPRAHRFAGRDRIALREVLSEPLILPERGSLTQRVMIQAMAQHGLTPQRRLNTTTFPVMKEAILNGAGVGVFLANAGTPDDGLVQIPIDELTEQFDIYAAVPKHKFRLRLVRSFWDQLDTEPVTVATDGR